MGIVELPSARHGAVRRVVERVRGRRLTTREAEATAVELGAPLRGRDRLLALMDVGALVCRARNPRCDPCPLRRRCATRGGFSLPTAPRVSGRRRAGRDEKGTGALPLPSLWPGCGR